MDSSHSRCRVLGSMAYANPYICVHRVAPSWGRPLYTHMWILNIREVPSLPTPHTYPRVSNSWYATGLAKVPLYGSNFFLMSGQGQGQEASPEGGETGGGGLLTRKSSHSYCCVQDASCLPVSLALKSLNLAGCIFCETDF